MLGFLSITEYPYRGEPSSSVPKEPATLTQRVRIGEVSNTLHADTQIVALWATMPCKVLFFAGDNWVEGAEVPNGGFPITAEYEICRGVPMNTGMRIAVLPEDPIA